MSMQKTAAASRSSDHGLDIDLAVAEANIPTLMAVLIQLTGNLEWMSEKYRMSRPAGVGDNDTGGLDEAAQAEIRAAAVVALKAHLEGAPVAIQDPSPELIIDILRFTIGEPLPIEYGPMLKDDMRSAGLLAPDFRATLGADTTGAVPPRMSPAPAGFRVGIIGGGISGLTAAMAFEVAKIDYVILEKHDSVGGTWLENRYPGAGVDTPNHLYSWPGIIHDWRHFFSLRDDVLAYLKEVAERFTSEGRIRLNCNVRSATFDDDAGIWKIVYDREGTTTEESFDAVISAVGLFNTPSIPDIEGSETFKGEVAHTADWPDSIDLDGKRVGVIGTGASAMQLVPAIADRVKSLTVFQRSPQWIAPFEKFQVEVPAALRALIVSVPLYRWWYRIRQMWMFNDRFWDALEVDPEWPHPERAINKTNDNIRRFFTKYIQSELAGRDDLVEKVTPTYPPYVKRILFDNGWYKTLAKPNVELVAEGVERFEENAVVTASGQEIPLDVAIYASGFNAVRFLSTFELVGRDGVNVRDIWKGDDAKAYLGTVIPGFPNFFCMYGPNLQAGHGGSFMTTAAAQVNYIMTIFDEMFRNDIAVIDCKHDVCEEYNRRVDEANSTRIWTHSGTNNYYRNSSGRVVVNRAFKNLDFWNWTRRADMSEFDVLKRRRREAVPAAPRS